MKRILLMTGIYPPDIGGPATYIPQLESFLRARGWTVEVLTLADSDQKRSPSSDQVTRVRRSLPLPIRTLLTIVRGMRLAMISDVILANGLHEEAALISILSKSPMIAKVVGNPVWEKNNSINHSVALSEDAFVEFSQQSLKLGSRVRLKFWLWSLERAKALYVPGKILVEHLENLGLKSQPRVIPNGVSVDGISEESKEVDVLSISRLVPWKNIEILIESAKRKFFSLEIIGEGPQEDFLKEQSLGYSNIRFLGRLAPEAVQDRLRKTRIFALVSDYEGMSFSLIEALSLGVPCVVSDIKSNQDVIAAGGGVKVPLRDVRNTADVITKLLEDEGRLASIGKSALENAKNNFVLHRTMEKVERLLFQYAR